MNQFVKSAAITTGALALYGAFSFFVGTQIGKDYVKTGYPESRYDRVWQESPTLLKIRFYPIHLGVKTVYNEAKD